MLYVKPSRRKILLASYSVFGRQFPKGNMLMLKSMSSSFMNVLDTPCVLQQFIMSSVAHSIDNVLPSYKGRVAAISSSGFEPICSSGIWPNKSSRSSASLWRSLDASVDSPPDESLELSVEPPLSAMLAEPPSVLVPPSTLSSLSSRTFMLCTLSGPSCPSSWEWVGEPSAASVEEQSATTARMWMLSASAKAFLTIMPIPTPWSSAISAIGSFKPRNARACPPICRSHSSSEELKSSPYVPWYTSVNAHSHNNGYKTLTMNRSIPQTMHVELRWRFGVTSVQPLNAPCRPRCLRCRATVLVL